MSQDRRARRHHLRQSGPPARAPSPNGLFPTGRICAVGIAPSASRRYISQAPWAQEAAAAPGLARRRLRMWARSAGCDWASGAEVGLAPATRFCAARRRGLLGNRIFPRRSIVWPSALFACVGAPHPRDRRRTPSGVREEEGGLRIRTASRRLSRRESLAFPRNLYVASKFLGVIAAA